jgi:hypothetical protein
MDNRDNYNDLVARLRSAGPILDGEDELSAGVFRRIERLGTVRASRRSALLVGWTSAVAALLLAAVMSGEILADAPAPKTGTDFALRHLHAGYFENISRAEIINAIYESRKEKRARELIINRYLKTIEEP